MPLDDVESLLKAYIGLDVDSIGSSSIERAVRTRMSACALSDRHAYCEHVRASETELQELIEAVVVPETWFFRDREAFATLARLGHEAWLRAPVDRVLRLLSLPSSTGEEPYSMAMALLGSGVPADRFRIDAVDISSRALAQAELAVYGKNSFRSQDLVFRDRFFEAAPLGHHLSDTVRRQVHFRQGNVFAADFLPGQEIYDVIFCRNLLIYFDRATQDRAVTVLERLLTSNGTLFVAPSETGLLLAHDFVSAKIPLAFAFQKPAGTEAPARAPSATRPVMPPPPRRLAGTPIDVRQVPGPVAAAAGPQALPTAVPQAVQGIGAQPDVQVELEDAVRLADQGRFVEAATRCENHLQQYGPTAKAFHLLGLVNDAAGNMADASHYYRKALYLDPTDRETLVHFALLVEHQGNPARAAVLRDRARRLEEHGKI